MAATAASIKVDYWCTGWDGHDSSHLKWKSDVCGVWVVLLSVTDASPLFWHHLCEHKDDIGWLKMTSEPDVFHRVHKFLSSCVIPRTTRAALSRLCACLLQRTMCMRDNHVVSPPPPSCWLVGARLRIKWGEIKVYCSVMQSVPAVERWAGCPLRWADTQMI